MSKKDIKSLSFIELEEEIKALGEKTFRSKQVYEWLHKKQAISFDEMTNLSKSFREKLSDNYKLMPLEMVDRRTSPSDETSKFLFKLKDDRVIESVLMKYKHGNSVCISSQVGWLSLCSH